MTFSGEEFYKHFFCEFQVYVNQNREKWEKSEPDAEWTRYVKDVFLGELAKKLGFDQTGREGIHGIDLTWERSSDGMFVAIEHENDEKTIWDNEVPNLLKAAAPLKVLITYVDDAHFPGRETAKKLLDFLRSKKFNQEFLLILGTYSMAAPTDWIGYLYRPELTMHPLVCSSNRVKAESSPARKAWKTRRGEAFNSIIVL